MDKVNTPQGKHDQITWTVGLALEKRKNTARNRKKIRDRYTNLVSQNQGNMPFINNTNWTRKQSFGSALGIYPHS